MAQIFQKLRLSKEGTEQSPIPAQTSRFVPRKGTQRHCDHLQGLKPVRSDPNEREIQTDDVARFSKEKVSRPGTNGYWEISGQSPEKTWVTLIHFNTFELLIQSSPGHTITLGNLDIIIILERCLEDAGDHPVVRKLSSTATCWPGGFARFKWMLRGMMVESPGCPSQTQVPVPQRIRSLKQRVRGGGSLPQPQDGQGDRRQSLMQRAASLFMKRHFGASSSYTAGSPLQSTDLDGLPPISVSRSYG
ncbi:hypothetical protein VP1G_11496 [Cytospora mali]|uniref:Uncharacterized protein n=1 Tax=Cytospora mali TaxID=578113 RepID=A0A194VH55_CYTMA|nr:hypothetical protein VP1G_11496 [Valsa mali var. pyri (nom. inval.)]